MKSIRSWAAWALAVCAAAAQASPAGLWKTIDDESQQEKSHVRIVESGGVFTGSVHKVLDPAKQEARCDKCGDERKDMPILGMTIIRNVKPGAGDSSVWDGGDILDPNNGKVYRVRLKPIDGGAKLEVRGYVGPFYRNQIWIRVE